MANALKLEVILNSVDKMTAPIRKALGASQELDHEIADLRKELLVLNKTQKNMTAFKSLKLQSKETTKELDAAQKKAQALAIQFNKTENPTKTLTNQFERAKRAVHRLKDKQTDEIRSLDNLRGKLNEAGISTNRLTKAQRQVTEQTNKATKALDAQANKLKALKTQQRAMNKMRYRRDRSMQMASNMTIAGAGGVATGRRIAQTALSPVQVTMDFEEQMSKVQALTRLDKSKPEQAAKMQAMRTQAMDLGATTSFSASEVGGAQSFLAMSGFNPDKIMKSLPGMLSLAKAAGTELAQTADISSNILSGFRLEADQMGRVGDVLTATFTRSNVDLSMLGESMKYAAPVAAELGISLEETAAMAGLLGNVGIQSSMAGTAMRALFSRMAAPPKMAEKALEEIGVKTTDATGKMRAVPEILAEIAKKTETMGNAQRMGIFKAVAGAEAGAAMATLVAKEGAAGITKFTGVLQVAAGEADRVAKTMSDNSKGLAKEASSAWEGLQITLGSQLKPEIDAIIRKVTEITRSVQQWTKEHPELASMIMKVAIGLGVLMVVMGAIGIAIASILGPMIMLRFGLGMLRFKALGAAGGLFGLIGKLWGAGTATAAFAGRVGILASLFARIGLSKAASGIGFLLNGFKRFGGALLTVARVALPAILTGIRVVAMALLTNPIGLIITGIATAAYLIITNWETVKSWMGSFWEGVKAVASTAWDLVKTLFSWSPLGLVIQNWQPLMSWFKALPGKMLSIGGDIINGLINGIKNKFTTAKSTIMELGSSIKGWFKSVLGISSPSKVFANFGGDLMSGLINGIKSKLKAVRQAIGSVGEKVTNWFKTKLGINSPSRVFIQHGHHINEGLKIGLMQSANDAIAPIKNITAQLPKVAAVAIPMMAASMAMPAAAQMDKVLPAATPPAVSSTQSQQSTQNITINIQPSAGMNENQLAELVEQKLRQINRQQASDSRGNLYDGGDS